MKTKLTPLALAAACLALLCVTPVGLPAATTIVTSTADNGPGTLRAALASAAIGDTIAFAVSGSITLTSGQLSISNSVTLLGPGPGALTVSGNNASRVFEVTGANVAISGLTIADGQGALYGAGIRTDGAGSAVTIHNCVLTNNNTSLDGGGIFNSPGVTLTLVNCALYGNTATRSGGGVFNRDSTVTVIASTLGGNSASQGGGIFNQADSVGATVAIQTSTLNNNSASYGGGIYNHGPNVFGGTITIANSTLSSNSASSGGGISNDGAWNGSTTLKINACTFNGNSANDGGIHLDGRFGGSATLEIGDTILNAGTVGATIYIYSGTVTSRGYNLSSDDGGGCLTDTTDQTNTDPRLGPLQNNGGPTFTHALLPASPALDKGNTNALPALARITDQRGLTRLVDNPYLANAAGGDGSDIGAFEVQGSGGFDTDADELPDFWELACFGNLGQCGTDDPDGDGVSNSQERLADTSPVDANDNLRITSFTRSGTYNTLWWTSKSTRLYQVERRASLDPFSPWETIITNAVPGWNNVGFDSTGPQYFYRIRVVLP